MNHKLSLVLPVVSVGESIVLSAGFPSTRVSWPVHIRQSKTLGHSRPFFNAKRDKGRGRKGSGSRPDRGEPPQNRLDDESDSNSDDSDSGSGSEDEDEENGKDKGKGKDKDKDKDKDKLPEDRPSVPPPPPSTASPQGPPPSGPPPPVDNGDGQEEKSGDGTSDNRTPTEESSSSDTQRSSSASSEPNGSASAKITGSTDSPAGTILATTSAVNATSTPTLPGSTSTTSTSKDTQSPAYTPLYEVAAPTQPVPISSAPPKLQPKQTAAVVGVVLGGTALLLLLLLATFLFIRARRKRNQPDSRPHTFYKDKMIKDVEDVPPTPLTPVSISSSCSESATHTSLSEPLQVNFGGDPAFGLGIPSRTSRQMQIEQKIFELQSSLISLSRRTISFRRSNISSKKVRAQLIRDKIGRLEKLKEGDWAREKSDEKPADMK
ncbi:hypothetical protein AAF712_008912 [Marasmius tenuissimus]|uniref:Uncharacterized protein n=1 Tax=Marasmius tenuissimus TaxID=585030 RepID=A0ABR2ZSD5_9AGAR